MRRHLLRFQLVEVLGLLLAVAGCALPHTTMRRVLGMSALEPITVESIRQRATERFPVGTPRETVLNQLPPSTAYPALLFVSPLGDWWEVEDHDHDQTVWVSSTRYSSLFGRYYYYIDFRFLNGKLSAIEVGKKSIHL